MRKRSRIKQEINKMIFTGKKNYVIVYIDRSRDTGIRLRELPISKVARVTEWALYLDDDYTVIPLHRVVEIRDREGRIIWRRSGGQDIK